MALQSLQKLINRIETQDAWKTHQRFQRILAHWSSIVGEVVASKARPFGIQKETLLVAVFNAVWAQNLGFERQRILQKISQRFPDIVLADIRFSTTQWHTKQGTTNSASNSLDDNPEILELWRSHPSQLSIPSANRAARHLSVVPKAPEEAFQQWADQIQLRSQHLPLCPTCGCPTPDGELARWAMCGLCITKQWATFAGPSG
ncbi:MAG: DUF721 domain-containing protein [Cyanobacteria bacterium P01_E01_bin.6]